MAGTTRSHYWDTTGGESDPPRRWRILDRDGTQVVVMSYMDADVKAAVPFGHTLQRSDDGGKTWKAE